MSGISTTVTAPPVRMTSSHAWAVWAGGAWSALLLVASLMLGRTVLTQGPVRFGSIFYVDAFGALMIGLISFVSFAATLYSAGYMRHEVAKGEVTEREVVRYYGWFHLFALTMVAAAVVENMGLLWVAVEATTLVSAVLVAFYHRRNALEAAWKYVILCSVGIAFALLGLILLYSAGVKAGLDAASALNFTELATVANKLDPATVRMAFALVLVGFGTKTGLAPMHNWLPDAHSQAPSPVSALLSGVLLNTALYAILRFHMVAAKALGPSFSSHLLLGFGLLSLGVAAFFILVQRDIKRLLAYSSVEHMGLICIGVGLGGPVGLYGAVLHMVGHAMAKSLLFFTAGNVGHRYHTYRMVRIQGVLKALPFTGTMLIIGALAITGVPGTAVFLSEFSIIAAAFGGGHVWAGIGTLAGIALAFAGIMLHVREMALGDAPKRITVGEQAGWSALPLLLPLVVVIVLGFWIPSGIGEAVHQVALLLGGGV